jgi:hypothetical protein
MRGKGGGWGSQVIAFWGNSAENEHGSCLRGRNGRNGWRSSRANELNASS